MAYEVIDEDLRIASCRIATAYLGAEYERRKELKEKAPASIRESVNFLEKCYQQRVFDKRTFQAVNNMLSKTQRKYVTHLLNEKDPVSAVYIAFRAGMISGKRIERARRARNHD